MPRRLIVPFFANKSALPSKADHVILSEAKNLAGQTEILRFAQNDTSITALGR